MEPYLTCKPSWCCANRPGWPRTRNQEASVMGSADKLAVRGTSAEAGIPMLLQSLREEVLEANLELVRRGLVLYTFGNASGISREDGLIAIKPSGVPYDKMTPQDLVITDLEGRVVEGKLQPSSDLPTHVELYKRFPNIGGVAH